MFKCVSEKILLQCAVFVARPFSLGVGDNKSERKNLQRKKKNTPLMTEPEKYLVLSFSSHQIDKVWKSGKDMLHMTCFVML